MQGLGAVPVLVTPPLSPRAAGHSSVSLHLPCPPSSFSFPNSLHSFTVVQQEHIYSRFTHRSRKMSVHADELLPPEQWKMVLLNLPDKELRWQASKTCVLFRRLLEPINVAVQCCVSFAGKTGRRKRPLYRLEFVPIIQSSVTDESRWPGITVARDLICLNRDVPVGATKDDRYKALAFSVNGIDIVSCDSPWCDKAPLARTTSLLQYFNVTVLKISTDFNAERVLANEKWNNLYCTIIKCLEHNNVHLEIYRLLISPVVNFCINWIRGIRTRRKIQNLRCIVLFDRILICNHSVDYASFVYLYSGCLLVGSYTWSDYLLVPLSRAEMAIRVLGQFMQRAWREKSDADPLISKMSKHLLKLTQLARYKYPLLPVYYTDDCFVSEQEADFAVRPGSLAFYDPTPFDPYYDGYNF